MYKKVTPEDFERIAKSFRKKFTICPKCSGVGCLPQHFGYDNPNSQPCSHCNGNGYVKRFLSSTAEHLLDMQEVPGSTPGGSTNSMLD